MSGQVRKTNELCYRQNWQGQAELPAGVTNGSSVVLWWGEPQHQGARWPPATAWWPGWAQSWQEPEPFLPQDGCGTVSFMPFPMQKRMIKGFKVHLLQLGCVRYLLPLLCGYRKISAMFCYSSSSQAPGKATWGIYFPQLPLWGRY